MKEFKTFGSTDAMVRGLLGEEEGKEIQKKVESRALINQLMAQRLRLNLSQTELGARAAWSQSKVSKFEQCSDAKVEVGEVAAYAKALGMAVSVIVHEKKRNAVAEIKHHAFKIKELMEHIVALAGEDAKMIDGVKQFVTLEVPVNLLNIVIQVASKLPQTEVADDVNEDFEFVVDTADKSDELELLSI